MPKLIFREQKLSSDRLKRKLKGKELDWYQRDRQLEVNRAYRDAWHLPPKKEPVRSARVLCCVLQIIGSNRVKGPILIFYFLFLSCAIDMTT